MVHYCMVHSFLHSRVSLACVSALIFFFLSHLPTSLLLILYSSNCLPSLFLSRVHILYSLIDPNENLRAILCLPGSFDCSFEDVASFNLDSAYRAFRRLKSSNKPAEERRSKFQQFAYIFRRNTNAKPFSHGTADVRESIGSIRKGSFAFQRFYALRWKICK